MYKTLDDALLKITEMQQQLETEQQVSVNLQNELNSVKESLQNKEQEITRLQGINQQFFLKLTQQDNTVQPTREKENNHLTDNTLTLSELAKNIIKK